MLFLHSKYYSCVVVYSSINEKQKELYDSISAEFESISCELTGFIETLSWIKLCIPPKKKLKKAAIELMALSNSLYLYDNSQSNDNAYIMNKRNKETAEIIMQLLKINTYTNKKK